MPQLSVIFGEVKLIVWVSDGLLIVKIESGIHEVKVGGVTSSVQAPLKRDSTVEKQVPIFPFLSITVYLISKIPIPFI